LSQPDWISPAEAAKELLWRRRARKQFYAGYVERVFRTVSPGSDWTPNWHIDLMCEYLDAQARGELPRLIINIPPRETKSITVCVAYSSWLLGRDPSCQIMAGSYGDTLAMKHSVDTRLVMTSTWYRALFPKTKLSRDQNEKHKFVTTARGHRVAVTVGGSVIGDGGDFLILDDPIKREDALSDKVRKSTNDWIDQTFMTRLNNPETGAVVLIMQRFHDDDPTGHLLAKESGWEHLKIPRISTESKIYSFGQVKKYYPKGSTMNPQRVSLLKAEQMRRDMGSYGFASQQQQDPVDLENALFKPENWRFYRALPADLDVADQFIQSWDMAFKDTDQSAYVVGQVWARFGARRYLLDQVRRRMAFVETVKAVREMTARWPGARPILIEDKANGPAVVDTLRKHIAGILPLSPGSDSKIARAEAWSMYQEAGNIYLPMTDEHPWVKDFIDEHTRCPSCTYWDQVDAAGQANLYLRKDSGNMDFSSEMIGSVRITSAERSPYEVL